jgi:uncharacterized protein
MKRVADSARPVGSRRPEGLTAMTATGRQEKKERLVERLLRHDSLFVAFSGGVDSSLLLAVAHQLLGERVTAVTVTSPVHAAREIDAARTFARERGIRHILLPVDLMSVPGFTANTPERCYLCKKALFAAVARLAADMGGGSLVHGANRDDLNDYRPGFRAADEAGVTAPLVEAGLTKADVRSLARQMGLSTWDKPAMACLASRIPYGTALTLPALATIEQAESVLRKIGIDACRVRLHGDVARIEVAPEAFSTVLQEENRVRIIDAFRRLDIGHVSLDLEGYRTGSMNRAIEGKADTGRESVAPVKGK